MKKEQTEVDLLMLAITDKSGTQDAFAKLLGMTRQNLTRIINQAKDNGGKLKPKFVAMLKKVYDVDIYVWKRTPTADFHSSTEMESMKKIMKLSEPDEPYMTKKLFEHLVDENNDLRNRLRDCEQALAAQKKKGPNSA